MKNVLMTLVLALAAPAAFAGGPVQSPEPSSVYAYSCDMQGDMSGIDLGVGLSGEAMGGRGTIHCEDQNKNNVDVPVRITILGAGPGFDFSVIKHVRIMTAGLGYVRSPMDLTGQFSLALSAGVVLINQGWSVDSAVSVKRHLTGLTFELGFQSEEAYGLGAHLHGLVMIVNPVHAKHPNK